MQRPKLGQFPLGAEVELFLSLASAESKGFHPFSLKNLSAYFPSLYSGSSCKVPPELLASPGNVLEIQIIRPQANLPKL